MTQQTLVQTNSPATWRAYLELCKPRVVVLMLITTLVGMLLASHAPFAVSKMFFGLIGIGLCAGSAAAVNHVLEENIDAKMGRTKNRPLPSNRLTKKQTYSFIAITSILGICCLWFLVNPLTTILTVATQFGYAVVYTMFLKRATPQNIVIGGAAGATPPLLGWTAVTGHFAADSLLLVLIIFTWTPPHFWSLAIHRKKDYEKSGLPMLPVTHGVKFTKLNILLYSVLLCAVTALPYVFNLSHLFYLITSSVLDLFFLGYAIKLYFDESNKTSIKMFKFSIWYLFFIFMALLIDHFII